MSLTSFSDALMMAPFSGGTNMSSMAIEIPARVAKRKPFCNSLSANTTVSFKPHLRNDTLMSLEISFFFNDLLMLEKGKPLGKISDNKARPTVVSTKLVVGTNSPVSLSLVHSVKRTATLAVNSTTPASKARCTSVKLANTKPSPLPLIRSRVA